jgi:hypothetical protein
MAATALAAPAQAGQLVFDVTITSYTDTDINGVTTTTPFAMQYAQTFQIGSLPTPGSSVFQVFNVGPNTVIQNFVQTGAVVTSSPLDATVNAFANVQTPFQGSFTEFDASQAAYYNSGSEYGYQSDAAISMQSSYYNYDGVNYNGSNLSTSLGFADEPVSAPFPADPTPMSINQVVDLLAGSTWTYSVSAENFGEAFDANGNLLSGFDNTRTFTGIATLDLAQSSLVPEPRAWGLMILGFGLAGAGLRRRRAAVAQAV